ncbi:hypothetical protein ACFQVA_15720 [Actinomadura keratinilytica]
MLSSWRSPPSSSPPPERESRARYQRTRAPAAPRRHRRRTARRRGRRPAARPARPPGQEPRPGRAAPRRRRHRRDPAAHPRPGRRVRPQQALGDAGEHRHQLDSRPRHPPPPGRRRDLAPPARPHRAPHLPLRALQLLPAPTGASPKAFVALLLLLETGTLATFAVLDLVLFFLAFETVLIPMYFLIARWGAPPANRRRGSSSSTPSSAP